MDFIYYVKAGTILSIPITLILFRLKDIEFLIELLLTNYVNKPDYHPDFKVVGDKKYMLPNDAEPSMDKKIGCTQEWLLWVHLNEYVKLKD